jgi:apolipoprotein N-acyltransferase
LKFRDRVFVAAMGLAYAGLSTLAFAPFDLPLLAWIALCPLLAGAVKFRDDSKSLVIFGVVCATSLAVVAFHWIIPSTYRVVGGNAWISGGVFLVFVLTFALREVVFVWMVGWLARESTRRYLPFNWLSVACVAVLVDAWIPKVIPVAWGNLISGNDYLVQLTEYTGTLGLTFLLVTGNFLLYRCVISLAGSLRSGRWRVPPLSPLDNLGLAALLGGLVFGGMRLHDVRIQQAALPTIRVATIQPHSPLVDRNDAQASRDAVYTLVGDTIPGLIRAAGRAGGNELDLVVLPEGAIPFASTNTYELTRQWGLYAPPVVDMITAMAAEQNAGIFLTEPAIVVGDGEPWQANGVPVNSAVLISADGVRGDTYEKNILFPVGEIVPFAKTLKLLGVLGLLPDEVLSSQFRPGTTQDLIAYDLPKNPLAGGRFLPLICFESIFPEYARAFFAPEGSNPDYIVNVTQDGWFDGSIALSQHFELARIRAIETRRALVRAANIGLSVLVGIDGQNRVPVAGPAITDGQAPGFQVWDVPVQRAPATFYVRHGDAWISWFAVSVLLLGGATRLRLARQLHA